jgi:hypothetical protein
VHERGLGLGWQYLEGHARGAASSIPWYQAPPHGTRQHHNVLYYILSLSLCHVYYHAILLIPCHQPMLYHVTLYIPCHGLHHTTIYHDIAYITLYIPCHGLYHHVEHSDGLALKQSVYLALLRPFTQNCRKRQPFARTHGRFGHAHSATTVGSWCVSTAGVCEGRGSVLVAGMRHGSGTS